MQKVNLRSLDLNLLLILDVLLEERHVSRAALALNMSQPAVSRALGRLREGLGDPLLVRTGEGYDLSARALELKAPLKAQLKQLQQLISPPEFNPALDQSCVRITGLDLELSLYVPGLIRHLRRLAPQMRFETLRQDGDSFMMLDRDEVDFCLSGLAPAHFEGSLHRFLVAEMPIVCLMDQQHPLAQSHLRVEDYAQAHHGLVSITGRGPGFMDKILAQRGWQRQVMLRLSGFTSVADFCVDSNLIFTLPQAVAERIAAGHPLCLRPMPAELELPPVRFYWYWHARNHQDPRCIWIREEFQRYLSAQESSLHTAGLGTTVC